MKIVIIGYFTEYSINRITPQFPKDWTVDIVAPENAAAFLHDADVVIPEHIRVDSVFLDKAPHLKLVQTGAGYDNVNVEECTRRGIWAANAAGVNAVAVAEHVLAFILAWFKNIPYLDAFMKNKEEETRLFYTGSELEGKTIGIFGVGAIGKNVARYCNALNMRVIGYSRRPLETEEKIESVTKDILYRESDILTVHVPLRDLKNVLLTPHTAGMPDGLKFHKTRYRFFMNNIIAVMEGKAPASALNQPVNQARRI